MLDEVRNWAVDATASLRPDLDWPREANESSDYPMTTISVPSAEPASPDLIARMGEADARQAVVRVEVRALTMQDAYDRLRQVEDALAAAQGDRILDFGGYSAEWEGESTMTVVAVSEYTLVYRG